MEAEARSLDRSQITQVRPQASQSFFFKSGFMHLWYAQYFNYSVHTYEVYRGFDVTKL